MRALFNFAVESINTSRIEGPMPGLWDLEALHPMVYGGYTFLLHLNAPIYLYDIELSSPESQDLKIITSHGVR